MKKVLLILILLFGFIPLVKAEEKDPVKIYIFTKEGCGACEMALEYFSQLATDEDYKDKFTLVNFQVYDSNWNVINQKYKNIASKIASKKNIPFKGTPYIIIGETIFDSLSNSYEQEFKDAIDKSYKNGYLDLVENVDSLEDDSNKGMQIFLNVITVVIVGGLIAGIVVTRLPKNFHKENTIKKSSKK